MEKFRLAFLIAFALGSLLLAAMAFASPAYVATQEGRYYRGYLDLCVTEPGRLPQCGHVQSADVFSSLRECRRELPSAIITYEELIQTTRPRVSVMAANLECKFDPDLYDA